MKELEALIFAAGLGTRFKPYTDNCPKALVKVAGKPLLLHALEKIVFAGVKRIVVNVHHFADQVIDFVDGLNFTGVDIVISDERNELLDTGGGLIKAFALFSKGAPLLLYNADVISNVDLKELYRYHQNHQAKATLLMQKRVGSRYFLFDEHNRLSGWENSQTHEKIIIRNADGLKQRGFCGIHIIQPELVKCMGEKRKFSITKGYLDLGADNSIIGCEDWSGYWFDVGSGEKLEVVERFFQNRNAQ